MIFFNLLRRQIAPVGLLVTTNINNIHRRFMSRLRKYYKSMYGMSNVRLSMCVYTFMCVCVNEIIGYEQKKMKNTM